MHSILIVVEQPDFRMSHQASVNWQNFLGQLADLAKEDPAISVIALGTIEYCVNDGMSGFWKILQSAENYSLSYRTLFFQDKPKWILSNTDKFATPRSL